MRSQANPKNYCTTHHLDQTLLCMNIDCKEKKRLNCEKCFQKDHLGHNYTNFQKSATILTHLNQNSKSRDSKYFMQRLKEDQQLLIDHKQQFQKVYIEWHRRISYLLFQYETIIQTFSNSEFENISDKIDQKNMSNNDADFLLKKIILLQKQQYLNNPNQVIKVSEKIKQNLEEHFKNFMKKSHSNFSTLFKFFDHYNFNNANLISQEDSIPYYGSKNDLLQNSEKKKKVCYNDSFYEQFSHKIIDKAINKFWESIGEKIEKKDKEIAVPQIVFEQAKMVKIEEPQNPLPENIEFSEKKIKFLNSQIHKKESIKRVIDQKASKTVQQFSIFGNNRFDEQCLEKCLDSFPNLKKFNYIWDFQPESIIELQKLQVFHEATIYQRATFLPSCQAIFNLYGQFKQLENLCVGNFEDFAKNQVKIKNQNIKTLTVNQYKSSKREMIPENLTKQLLQFNQVLTLNLFNIQLLDIDFFCSFLINNQSLKTLFISEATIQSGLLSYLQRTNLESIFFQFLVINEPIYLPKTLKNLIIDDCRLPDKHVCGLKFCENIQNLSFCKAMGVKVVDNEEASMINDKVLLSLVCPQKIEYLNLAKCPSITNDSLEVIEKMQNLKYLCLDHTKIGLEKLVQKLEGKRIKKISIIGLEKYSQDTDKYCESVYQIGKICPKIEFLNLTFKQGLTKRKIEESFPKLKNIYLALPIEENENERRLLSKLALKLEEAKIVAKWDKKRNIKK